MMSSPLVFSTKASDYLAQKIALQLGVTERGQIDRRIFPGGERYYRIGIDDRAGLMGKDVVFVGSTHTDDDLQELHRVGCALAGYGARSRIFVIPFFGYSTMERAKLPGEVVTAKTCMRFLSSIPNTRGGNTFLFLDLHNEGLVHYMEGDCLRFETYAESTILTAIRQLGLSDFIFGSADLGRPKWIRTYAKHFGVSIVLVDKGREFEITKVNAVIGNPAGKTVIIYDDMIRGGSSLIDAANAYLGHNAKDVYAVVSHLALNDESVVRKLEASPIVKIIGTNSHPMSQHPLVARSSKIQVLDISPVFAHTVAQLLA
ncbi:MAG: ribose-phosphate pyrophosphokinase [Parcubacteria group bacterium Gr01-1014_20]|nr:MAG: ribose-phosphate pyrophosphokinase [Parcubacteria group bacterium Gr01-1014_20]